jgi:hypothetical protein
MTKRLSAVQVEESFKRLEKREARLREFFKPSVDEFGKKKV